MPSPIRWEAETDIPIQGIGTSLAQLLLHHWLHDSIPSQPILYKPHSKWIAAMQHCEEILQYHNTKRVERYNKYTHNLPFYKLVTQ